MTESIWLVTLGDTPSPAVRGMSHKKRRFCNNGTFGARVRYFDSD